MREVIVGVDRSETARAAAKTAAELARALGCGLHVVMCVDRGDTTEVAVGGDRFRTDWLAEAEHQLDDIVRSLGAEQTSRVVGVGDPARMLVDEATRLDARMIVVGNRRVQGIDRVLGSVAGKVTRTAPCDVLVANTSSE